MPTAVLIDGGFFLKRFPHVYKDRNAEDPKVVAKTMYDMACYHLTDPRGRMNFELYRIFFYDCPPILKRAHYPISERGIDFSRTPTARFRLDLHEEIKRMRKVALRLGHLSDDTAWRIKPRRLEDLLKKRERFEDLCDDDFIYDARQKGVDGLRSTSPNPTRGAQ